MKERMDENHPWVTEDDIEFIQCNNQFQEIQQLAIAIYSVKLRNNTIKPCSVRDSILRLHIFLIISYSGILILIFNLKSVNDNISYLNHLRLAVVVVELFLRNFNAI